MNHQLDLTHQHLDERLVRMDLSPLKAALADVVAIPVTPFAEDGSIDVPAHRVLLRRLLDGGVRIVTPNGNTGEFYALTPDERRAVTELTIEEAGGRATVLVGVGHDVPTAVAAAEHARDSRRRDGDGPPAGPPLRLAGRLGRLPPGHRRGRPRARGRPVRP